MMTYVLGIFNPIGFLFYAHHNLIEPLLLQKKIGLSLSHLVSEILGPTVALIGHQNVLFNSF